MAAPIPGLRSEPGPVLALHALRFTEPDQVLYREGSGAPTTSPASSPLQGAQVSICVTDQSWAFYQPPLGSLKDESLASSSFCSSPQTQQLGKEVCFWWNRLTSVPYMKGLGPEAFQVLEYLHGF